MKTVRKQEYFGPDGGKQDGMKPLVMVEEKRRRREGGKEEAWNSSIKKEKKKKVLSYLALKHLIIIRTS